MAVYPLNTGANVSTGSNHGLAVDVGGVVWIAANTSLLRLTPSSGDVTTWAIPAGGDSSVAEQNRPPNLRGVHSAEAIAVDDHGHIAVAVSASTTLQIFSVASQQFTQIGLPAIGEPQGVAYASDGTLAVSMRDLTGNPRGTLVVVKSDGRSSTVSVDAGFLSSMGTEFITGVQTLIVVTTSGVTRSVPNAATSEIPSGTEAAVLPDGRIASRGLHGLVIVNPSDGSVKRLDLPSAPCGVGSHPIRPGDPTLVTPNPTCELARYALRITADGGGDIWFLASGPPTIVLDELAAGSY